MIQINNKIKRILESIRKPFKGIMISERESWKPSYNVTEVGEKEIRKIPNKEYKFEPLAPNDNVDLRSYREALDQMMNDNRIFNVGLTGAYGSGKSSIIESYKKENKDKKFIHIALGKYGHDSIKPKKPVTFESKKLTKGTYKGTLKSKSYSDDFNDFKEIEGKIINQLLHQVDVKRVPQAFTKVKKNNSSTTVIWWSFIVPSVILSLFYVIKFEAWVQFLNSNDMWFLYFTRWPYFRPILILLLLMLLGFITYILGKAQINRSLIRKIAIRGSEIELFKNDENSFFDEHLNEVIYLFENSGADVIVFEDLDRFDNPDVFRKLRELNQMINKRKQNNLTQQDVQKKIVFLYLIKDDIFESKNRTKFFDFIIPVVPVVTSANSFEQIQEIFGNSIGEYIGSRFLRQLSLYIDDMRLIKNIFNEYTILYIMGGLTLYR